MKLRHREIKQIARGNTVSNQTEIWIQVAWLVVLYLVLLNCLHWCPTYFPDAVPSPSRLALVLPDRLSCRLRIPFPVTVYWSHWASEGLSGHSSWILQRLLQHRKLFVWTQTFLTINKSQSFILMMTQPRGEVLIIPLGGMRQERWLKLYSQVAGGIPSFLHKLQMWKLCVVSQFRRGWLRLTCCKGKFISLLI